MYGYFESLPFSIPPHWPFSSRFADYRIRGIRIGHSNSMRHVEIKYRHSSFTTARATVTFLNACDDIKHLLFESRVQYENPNIIYYKMRNYSANAIHAADSFARVRNQHNCCVNNKYYPLSLTMPLIWISFEKLNCSEGIKWSLKNIPVRTVDLLFEKIWNRNRSHSDGVLYVYIIDSVWNSSLREIWQVNAKCVCSHEKFI